MMPAGLILLTSLMSHPSSSAPRPRSVELTGQVREVSASPSGRSRAVLEVQGKSYTLHGTHSAAGEELARLSGLRVQVYGVISDPRLPRGNHVLVERYDILDVGEGQVPRIGVIAAVDLAGQKRLLFVDDRGRADLLPKGWGEKMTRHIGAKLWMISSGQGASFKPERFAILRTARAAATAAKTSEE